MFQFLRSSLLPIMHIPRPWLWSLHRGLNCSRIYRLPQSKKRPRTKSPKPWDVSYNVKLEAIIHESEFSVWHHFSSFAHAWIYRVEHQGAWNLLLSNLNEQNIMKLHFFSCRNVQNILELDISSCQTFRTSRSSLNWKKKYDRLL